MLRLLLIAAAAVALHGEPAPPVLTRADRVRALSAADAARGLPVRLRAVVTFREINQAGFYVHDGTGGLFVNSPNRKLPVRAGDRIELEAVTAPGGFVPSLLEKRTRRLGRAPYPQPRAWRYADMALGRAPSEWVRARAVVMAARMDPRRGRLTLQLSMDGKPVEAQIPNRPSLDAARLTGARVRLEGVCATRFNGKRQFTGFYFRIPSVAEIHLEQPGPADPFTAPLRPAAELMRYAPAEGFDALLRVRGTVTWCQTGQWLYIRDGAAPLRIQTSQKTSARPGDVVEAVGFAAPGDYGPLLRHAVFRVIDRGAAPAPAVLTAQQAMASAPDASLVRIDGLLMNRVRRTHDQVLVLEAGGLIFNARLEEGRTGDRLEGLRTGSRLSLTGICAMGPPRDGSTASFELLLRDRADVRLLAAPPWWNMERALSALAALTALVLAAVVWVGVLRRRVARQTRIIRERLEREQALEERYRDLVENANDLIFTADMEGRLTSINGAGERVSGYRREEILGIQAGAFARTPEDARVIDGALMRLKAGGQATFEVELGGKDGAPKFMEVSARAVHRPGRQPEVEGIARDISERKRAEAALQQAKAAAEAASRAKSQFLANMSHEIRTPLNGLMGMTELALETDLSDEQRDYLATVQTSAEALLDIINEVLDFSKIESGKMLLDPAPFELAPGLEDALRPLAVRAARKGVAFDVEISDAARAWFLGDSGRLRQVLVNLAGNAVKFTESGHVRVIVEAAPAGDSSMELRFAVEDTGIGIPREKHEQIFDAFVQVDGSMTRRYGGTGLGLAISSRLVALMGGRLSVESEPGRGSVFRFTIALPVAAPAARAPARKPAPPAAARRLRVLLVEDNAVNQRLARLLLEKQGHAVTVAGDGLEALRAIESHPFDLVLMDVQMPHMDGLEAARAIREREKETGLRLPVVAMTAHALKGDRERCLEAGMDGYISKPIRADELLEAVAATAASRQGCQAATPN